MTSMHVRSLSLEGAWSFHPSTHTDQRGSFFEWFRLDELASAAGHPLRLAQANCSVSRSGVVRGIHFADVPPGQAKYVTCPSGAALDIVVDLRIGSPTFGQWDSVLLDDSTKTCVYLSEGLGHAFIALDDETTVMYLCSEGYAPSREHGVNPFDPEIGILWPTTDRKGRTIRFDLSQKDLEAPSLAQAHAAGLLPSYDDVIAYRRALAK